MKALYHCAKIVQSLQYNTRPLFTLGLLYFYSKVYRNTKNLETNYTFLVNQECEGAKE